ncbi:MAG: ribonuclease III [Oscillospiraceae bacterium]|nr:ribonuclease III [Oscillospiraceae bacterium]
MTELERKIGYDFKDKLLLETALTHSSYMNERSLKMSYERLEFLGDSVLGMLTAEMLYTTKSKLSEGELTKRRAMLVCEPSLANAANNMELWRFVRVGRGEEQTGGRKRPSIMADVVEAVLAAVYLDGGLDSARDFAKVHIWPAAKELTVTDFKTILQEKVQNKGMTATYHLIGEDGPPHMKRFTTEVRFDGKPMGIGEGTSKKEAEQAAAQSAMEKGNL